MAHLSPRQQLLPGICGQAIDGFAGKDDGAPFGEVALNDLLILARMELSISGILVKWILAAFDSINLTAHIKNHRTFVIEIS